MYNCDFIILEGLYSKYYTGYTIIIPNVMRYQLNLEEKAPLDE